MKLQRHQYSKADDRIIKRCVGDNIGNLRYAFKVAALQIGEVSAESVKDRYYNHIKPKLSRYTSLKKLVMHGGFFMISLNRFYPMGKNSEKANIKPEWVKKETVLKLTNNV